MPSAGALRAGRAVIEMGLDSKGIEKGLDRLQGQMRRFGKSLQSVGQNVALLGGAVTAAFIPAIKRASDFQETLSKFQVVFAEQADAVRAWGREFGETVGRSEAQVLKFLASSQDLFVPLGFDTDEAEDMSKQITQLAVDLGSFNNMADDLVLRDLQAAMTGSGEVMKKYGVLVSEAAVKQRLLNQSIDPRVATDQQKVLARLNIIMDGTTAAQGDAIRTSGSFANQMKRLRAEIDNTFVTIGSALLPVLTDLVSMMSPLVSGFGMWIEQNQKLVVVVAISGAALLTLGTATIVLGRAFIALSAAIKFVRTALTFLAKHPYLVIITLGVLAVGELTGAFDALGKKIDEVVGVSDGLENVAKMTGEFDRLKVQAEEATDAIEDLEDFKPPDIPEIELERRIELANRFDPAAAAIGDVTRRSGPSRTESLFDPRLARQILGGPQDDRTEERQLDELRKIRRAIENNQGGGIPVI